jgi:hypothetical protein
LLCCHAWRSNVEGLPGGAAALVHDHDFGLLDHPAGHRQHSPMRLIYSTRSPATLLYATGLQRLATPGTGLDIADRQIKTGRFGPSGGTP